MREPMNSTGFRFSELEISPRNLSTTGRIVSWAFVFLIAGVLFNTTVYMGVATFAYCCLILGLIERKKKQFHMSLMLTGMVTDIAMVLVLELSRSAIGTATGTSLGPWQYTHIATSLLAVLIYFPVIIHGYWLADRGADQVMRTRHVWMGMSAFAFRTVGWFTMFSFLGFSS